MKGMDDLDDLRLFEGLALEEPSRRADEAVLGKAREALRARRPLRLSSRATLWVHGGIAAAIVLGLFLAIPGSRDEIRRTETAAAAEFKPLEAIRTLQDEANEIKEMCELIPEDRSTEKLAIAEKIQRCLSDLEALERRLGAIEDGSLLPETSRKEVNI